MSHCCYAESDVKRATCLVMLANSYFLPTMITDIYKRAKYSFLLFVYIYVYVKLDPDVTASSVTKVECQKKFVTFDKFLARVVYLIC